MPIPRLPDYFPARYHRPGWFLGEQFDSEAAKSIAPGMSILDVGSGRLPAVGVDARPSNCEYLGLDISLSELQHAPPGSYDEAIASDALVRLPELEGRFDVVLSFQVLEHVKPLERAFENMIAYLKPGGRLVVQMSGTFSMFGLINQAVPQSLSVWAVRKATHRSPETIFPAHYHHCWATKLDAMLAGCREHVVTPLYLGGDYFAFLSPLARCYLAYENWAERGRHRNLGTHYLVTAVK